MSLGRFRPLWVPACVYTGLGQVVEQRKVAGSKRVHVLLSRQGSFAHLGLRQTAVVDSQPVNLDALAAGPRCPRTLALG